MIKILFICHGNICRSTMAEFLMKELVRRAGAGALFCFALAATSREEIGNDTHEGTKAILREKGIPFTPRKARQMTRQDYDAYTYLVGFDAENMREIRRIAGGDRDGKVFSLLSFAGTDRPVADPWYTGNFTATYADVYTGCTALWQYLQRIYPDLLGAMDSMPLGR